MPSGKRLMVVGDSYWQGAIGTTSVTATDDVRGISGHLARLLGLDHVAGSVSGSGISVANTSKWINRVPDIATIAPDYLFITGSVNDSAARLITLPADAAAYYAAVKAALPATTKCIVGGVCTFNISGGVDPTAADAVTAVLKSAAVAAGSPSSTRRVGPRRRRR
jgi:lysophospholipase L1-like esterase